jgi:hypothetical protein
MSGVASQYHSSMRCTIDRRGRAARFVAGLLLLAAGASAILLGAIGWPGVWAVMVGIVLAAGGAFALYEAAAGWCAVRAMGIRTRL